MVSNEDFVFRAALLLFSYWSRTVNLLQFHQIPYHKFQNSNLNFRASYNFCQKRLETDRNDSIWWQKFSIHSIVSESSIFLISAFWDFPENSGKFWNPKFEFSLWRIFRQIFFRSYAINTIRYQLLTADSDGLPWCVRKIVTYFGFLIFVILQIYQESRSSQISKCYQ